MSHSNIIITLIIVNDKSGNLITITGTDVTVHRVRTIKFSQTKIKRKLNWTYIRSKPIATAF